MKKLFIALILFSFLGIRADAKSLKINGKRFILKNNIATKTGYINEYIKRGDNINNWSEKVIVRSLSSNLTPKTYIKSLIPGVIQYTPQAMADFQDGNALFMYCIPKTIPYANIECNYIKSQYGLKDNLLYSYEYSVRYKYAALDREEYANKENKEDARNLEALKQAKIPKIYTKNKKGKGYTYEINHGSVKLIKGKN